MTSELDKLKVFLTIKPWFTNSLLKSVNLEEISGSCLAVFTICLIQTTQQTMRKQQKEQESMRVKESIYKP